jgi:putative restriction endonuclease
MPGLYVIVLGDTFECSKESRDVMFGHVPRVKLGQSFHNRTELSKALVHPPTQAGIAGNQSEGAASSIVLNGGYEDDQDYFEEIVYTGHGGRDESTGRQVSDQTLTKQNLHLARSSDLDVPVRVTRGPKAGQHAPSSGYRYDGLYAVERYWPERGLSGFLVWRFKLVALDTYDFSPDS